MITDKRLQWLSGPDYNGTEPGQIAAELLTARARIAQLEAALRKYGHHPTGCSDYREQIGRCTCGLDASLGSELETKGDAGG